MKAILARGPKAVAVCGAGLRPPRSMKGPCHHRPDQRGLERVYALAQSHHLGKLSRTTCSLCACRSTACLQAVTCSEALFVAGVVNCCHEPENTVVLSHSGQIIVRINGKLNEARLLLHRLHCFIWPHGQLHQPHVNMAVSP